ncbi:SGNH/GDSL hydrolase family protein [Bacillus sp. REN16]|uniref:SGNH/GDSL hydrolase family protein n=1 Tax=Bacillus sp. REN16 TaxID=2887296 RepID=UPI001E515C90|nr:GDSL-type esterase/lipase family protein [Bacillus sp. REN16]MCC3356107.1 SGNH/GDSL hydrolase family protein [Bacillus sp. REN16]
MSFFKKKKLSILFLLVLLFQAVVAPMSFAAEATADKPSLVALGDSITFGWNLYEGENPDISKPSIHAFPNYIGDGGFDVTNLSFPGWTSGDLLTKITSDPMYLPAIAQADVITLNIGNNDLLQAAEINKLISEGQALTPEKIEEITIKIKLASGQLAANLTQIMGAIRQVNQSAPIIFYNIYNPFGAHLDPIVPNLHMMGEQIITGVNKNVIEPIAAKVPGTILVDAYSAYNGKQATYIRPFPDVHPTVEGQKVLASLADQALLSLLPPELEILLTPSTTESSEGPVTINIATNHDEILELKWLPGKLAVEDFETEGNIIPLDNPAFDVTENGFYTVYILSGTGEKKVVSIEITSIVPKVVQPTEEPPVEQPPVEEPPATEDPKEGPKEEQKEEPKKEEPVKNEQKVTPEKKEIKSGPKLPNTASPIYNLLALGISALLIGSVVLFMYMRRNRTV